MAQERSNGRRYLQVGIRDLLILTAVVAVIMQAVVQHRDSVCDEQESAAILTEAGARIVFDADQDWDNPKPKCFPSQKIQEFVGREHFQNVISADLCGVDMTPERLCFVTRLKRLRTLHLVGSDVSDDTLRTLPKVKTLRELTLTGTRVTDEGIERLKSKMPQLAVRSWPHHDCGN
jgi:hypothetical protein